MTELPPHISTLLDPAAYPHPAGEISLIQTHISYVLLAGDFVYKIKKPVDFGFLDFTTLEKRKHFCEEELHLNRRLCPSIYLDCLPINHHNGEYSLNGAGSAIDYCVKMKRMPQEKMMGRVIAARAITRKNIDDIVATIEPFYDRAARSEEINSFGTAEAVGVNVLENFTQTEEYVGCSALSREEFKSISGYAKNFLQKSAIFEQRIREGRIRDCHGDLHSANICLADHVYIYDCIEFNKRFRYCDIVSDLAFLAMDLDFHNLPDLSDYLIQRYKDDSGDTGLEGVLNFYKCYRASVRGKIGLLTAHEPEVDDATRTAALEQATRYHILAQQYAERCRGGVC